MTYRKTMLSASIVAALMFAGTAVASPSTNSDVVTPASAVNHTSATTAAGPQQAAQDADQSTDQSTDQNKRKAEQLETITVTGILGSQMRSIQLKRSAPRIQDSISAENIGQLPDTTISDSLQRVTGVQIGRSAGEGSTVNIRGLSQVQTLLNGEVFLPASNIVGSQPNYSGIPAQLFNGVDVIKSPTSDLLNTGLSGTINLRTQRPWDMDMGWTLAGSLSASRGSEVGKTQPKGNFLVSFNDGGQWGVLLSVSKSNLTRLNSNFQTNQYGPKGWDETNGNGGWGPVRGSTNGPGQSAGQVFANAGLPLPSQFTVGNPALGQGLDLNGDGKYNAVFLSSHMLTATQDYVQRDRTGVNASFQFAFGGGLTLTADAFLTQMDQNNRMVIAEMMPDSWMRQAKYFTETTPTGSMITNSAGGQSEVYTRQGARVWLGDLASATQNRQTRSISRNYNVELKFDNGGFFSGSLRAISADAKQSQAEIALEMVQSDGMGWTAGTGQYNSPTGIHTFHPNGYGAYTGYIDVDLNGDPKVSLDPLLANRLSGSKNGVYKGLNGIGGYTRGAAMNIFRFDGSLFFDGGNKLDFGVRNSVRTAHNFGFMPAAPVYGCNTMYHAFDLAMTGACSAGDANGPYRTSGDYTGLTYDLLPANIKNNFKYYSNVGGSGIGLWALDPEAMDDPMGFLNSLYPGANKALNAQQVWDVRLHEASFYLQGDFQGNFGAVPYSANVGARVVRSKLHVSQSLSGISPGYGLPTPVVGKAYTDRSYTDFLPTANLALRFTPDFVVRASWSKNMVPLNLNQWAGGVTYNYALNNSTGVMEVVSGSQAGSPDLNPWRSTNAGLSMEYYLSDSSMVNLAYFRIQVDSFLQTSSYVKTGVPNQDGSAGNPITFTSPVQGEGVTLHGWEFNWRQAMDGLPGFLSDTGFTANWTYSPSNTGVKDLAGNPVPFANNSKYAGNLVLWYQGENLQVRVAGNYRSEQAVGANSGGIVGLEQYLDAQTFVDASVSYKINDNFQVFLKGSNLTGESQRYYLTWKDQFATSIPFEKRYELGVNVNF